MEAINQFSTQARGPDGIPECSIVAALPLIATHLRELFNASIRQSVFSSEWKKSLVIALNKVNTPSSPSDFRPISLLNCLSKAIEYIVHKQINAHIDTYNILDCMQTDFNIICLCNMSLYPNLSLSLSHTCISSMLIKAF